MTQSARKGRKDALHGSGRMSMKELFVESEIGMVHGGRWLERHEGNEGRVVGGREMKGWCGSALVLRGHQVNHNVSSHNTALYVVGPLTRCHQVQEVSYIVYSSYQCPHQNTHSPDRPRVFPWQRTLTSRRHVSVRQTPWRQCPEQSYTLRCTKTRWSWGNWQ